MKPWLAFSALTLALSACSSGTDGAAPSPPPTTIGAAPGASASRAPALSSNEKVVARFVGALDDLGITHSKPQRTEAAALSKASYNITVNGFEASIQIFATEQTQKAWVQASDSFGGICVVIDDATLSLNSSKGTANSAEIAPRIAEKVNGEARGT